MSRTQSIPSLNERLVKAAIHLLAHGTADDFENLLWQRRFKEVMSRQNSDYPVFSYDYASRHVLYDHVNTHVLKK